MTREDHKITFIVNHHAISTMGFLPDAKYCGLGMGRECRECRECFPRHRLQRKPLVSDSGMLHDTCVRHVPWCMLGSLTRGGIPGACTTRNLTYLKKGPSMDKTKGSMCHQNGPRHMLCNHNHLQTYPLSEASRRHHAIHCCRWVTYMARAHMKDWVYMKVEVISLQNIHRGAIVSDIIHHLIQLMYYFLLAQLIYIIATPFTIIDINSVSLAS